MEIERTIYRIYRTNQRIGSLKNDKMVNSQIN